MVLHDYENSKDIPEQLGYNYVNLEEIKSIEYYNDSTIEIKPTTIKSSVIVCIVAICALCSTIYAQADIDKFHSDSYAYGMTATLVNEGNSTTVSCPSGIITDVVFASYGTATGSNGNFAIGECHAGSSLSVVSAACLGKPSCTVLSHNSVFGDPCVNTPKHLYIRVACGSADNYNSSAGSSSASSSSDFSSSSSLSSSSSSGDISSSSSIMDIYEFCKENPANYFCTGQDENGCLPYPLSSPADPLSACFSIGGRCYALNPDRGTQYGWINNNAQDTWWWREVPCGVNPFPKRYISERNPDSFSAEENDSDYILRSKTKLFYDATGRRTATRPETRRYLFLPKK